MKKNKCDYKYDFKCDFSCDYKWGNLESRTGEPLGLRATVLLWAIFTRICAPPVHLGKGEEEGEEPGAPYHQVDLLVTPRSIDHCTIPVQSHANYQKGGRTGCHHLDESHGLENFLNKNNQNKKKIRHRKTKQCWLATTRASQKALTTAALLGGKSREGFSKKSKILSKYFLGWPLWFFKLP